MALPKEPRQKMINLMYLVLTALLALNVSSEILNAFKVVDKSLTDSNARIEDANKTLFTSFEEKLKDAQSAEKAKIWAPKAADAKKLSDEMAKYIDDLKEELKKEAGKSPELPLGKEDDLEAATRLFGEGEHGKKKGKELEGRLKAYRDAMLAIDPAIKTEFENSLAVDGKPATGQDVKQKDFTTAYFHMTPTVAALTLLSKFQNNVKNAENQVVTYCHNQIGAVKVIYDKFVPIVSTNATYLMPGQELEIKAGVGAFNTASKPVISIGGVNVPVDENGVGTSKRTVSSSGSVNVVVKYTKPDGTTDEVPTTVQYVVGTPSGASVSADRMNVFYIGVDNPVTISPGVGWDKASANFSGSGSMSGSGNNRTVRVSGGTEATITVTAENKTTPFKFRVKSIPDPYAMVGPSKGGRIAANVFKAQDFIRAQLDNFDFEAKFTVTSANVYFGGAGFQTGGGVQQGSVSNGSLGGIKDKMGLCRPGSIVSFDDIKAVGPDGRTRTIPPITFILN
jgi:gliding motility-associated protein GldM